MDILHIQHLWNQSSVPITALIVQIFLDILTTTKRKLRTPKQLPVPMCSIESKECVS